MSNPNIKPRFTKGSKEASEAGKKSKRRPLDHQWREKLNEYLKDTSNRTHLDEIYTILMREAKDGNIQAVKELLDRSYGKAKQPVEHTVNEGLEDKIKELNRIFRESNETSKKKN